MSKKFRYWLAGIILVLGSVLMVYLYRTPQYNNITYTPEAARTQAQPAVQPPTPAPAKRTDEPDIRIQSPGDNTQLLLVLAIIAAGTGAVLIFRRLIREQRSPALARGDFSDLVAELQNIAYKINSWTLEDSKKELERLNRNARQIGKTLYRQGGMARMLEAHRLAGSQRVIESAWDGVGPWRG